MTPLAVDLSFDVLGVLVFVVLPLALATVGLAVAVRGSSWMWRVFGYALAVSGTWTSVVAGAAIADCPAQDETCGDQSAVGDFGLLVAIVVCVGLAFVVRHLKMRWRSD